MSVNGVPIGSRYGAESKRKYFGLWTLIALVVGNAVGAGIYTTSGFAIADLGSPHWVLLAWIVAGVVALMGAISYGMLAQRLTESGGEYLYLSRSIHPLAGFIAGWISLLAGFPGAIAFAASAFEAYLISAFQWEQLPNDFVALGVIWLGGWIHYVRIQTGARAHEWFTAFMVMVLLIILGYATFKILGSAPKPAWEIPLGQLSWTAFATSLVWISLSYSGFNAAAYVAGEVRDGERMVARGMVIGTLITMALCVMVNAVILYGAPMQIIEGQANVAAIVAGYQSGVWGQRLVEGVIAVSLLTSITAMLLAGPRVYAKMAEDGALPKIFIAKSEQPPRAAIVLQMMTASLLIVVADLQDLLSYLGLTLSLCLALAVSSLFVRHIRFNEKPNSIWYPLAPLLFVAATILFACLTSIAQPTKAIAVLPTLAIGLVAYLFAKNSINLNIAKNE